VEGHNFLIIFKYFMTVTKFLYSKRLTSNTDHFYKYLQHSFCKEVMDISAAELKYRGLYVCVGSAPRSVRQWLCTGLRLRHASAPQLSFGRPTVQTYHRSRSSAYTLSTALQFFLFFFRKPNYKKIKTNVSKYKNKNAKKSLFWLELRALTHSKNEVSFMSKDDDYNFLLTL
jgi:hypothetical protein